MMSPLRGLPVAKSFTGTNKNQNIALISLQGTKKAQDTLCVLRSILIPLLGCVAHFIYLFRVCRLDDLPRACRNPVR